MPWQRDLRMFRQFTDEIVFEGLLTAVVNFWTRRGKVLASLRSVGAVSQADLIEKAIRGATTRRFGRRPILDPHSIESEPAKLAAFSAAEVAIEDCWEAMWEQAATFARRHGWAEELGA